MIEISMRARLAAGDARAAASEALRMYGAELYGFLCAQAPDESLAGVAFARAVDDLWSGRHPFRGDGSVRAWCYALAKVILAELRSGLPPETAASPDAERDDAMRTAIDGWHRMSALTGTVANRESRAERALRDHLTPEDQELMMLRIDRRLSWKDIARIRGGAGDLVTRAAALRKRFERARERLRSLASPSAPSMLP